MIDYSKGTGSQTISEVISPQQNNPAHLVFTLKDPVHQKVDKLLHKAMVTIESLESKYQPEVFSQVEKWKTSFFENYKIEKVAHMLLFLDNYLENVMSNYAGESDFEKVKWIVISNKIKNIVIFVLPKNIDVEAFIESDRQKMKEVQLRYDISLEIEEMMVTINTLFDELEDKLYKDADKLLDQMENSFQQLKSDLIALNKHQEKEIDHLHESLDNITESFSAIYKNLKSQITEIESHDKEITTTDNLLLQIRDELEALINAI
ncbi:MAG: hypothetical protein H0W50_02320 [Parachlamydiaceae bacterium]|nr:hypothetical protein [Parachlamydiaceae bacterium]